MKQTEWTKEAIKINRDIAALGLKAEAMRKMVADARPRLVDWAGRLDLDKLANNNVSETDAVSHELHDSSVELIDVWLAKRRSN